jgi:hypothetical protein
MQPVGNFYEDARKADGLNSNCRDCVAAAQRAARQTPEQRAGDMLGNARKRAAARGVPCTITHQEVLAMLLKTKVCPALKIPLSPGEGKPHDASPTLDCFNPALGYEPGNVFLISNRANAIKQNATAQEVTAVAKWMLRVTSARQRASACG